MRVLAAERQVVRHPGLMEPTRARRHLELLRRLAIWGAIAWIVVFWRLGYPGLLDPDEAHYAQLTREMMSAREWLIPLRDGLPFIDKPVLFHWLQGLSFFLFGVSELSARIPSALAALALGWFTYWSGREIFQDSRTGERAAMMFFTLPATFALGSIGLLDMTFAATLFGSAACLIVAVVRDRSRLQWPGYVLLSLSIMIKGPVALLLLATAFVLAVIAVPRARGTLGRLRWFAGPAIAAAAAAPWFVWMWWRFGDAFVEHYFVQGNVWYVTHPFQFRQPNYFFYVRTFFGAFLPWSLLVAGRAVDRLWAGRRALVTLGAPESLLWAWALAVIGVFTAARFKLDTYIYPAAPAVCLIAARAWEAARTTGEPARGQRGALAAISVVFVAAAIVLGATMFDLDLRLSPWALALPIGLGAGGAWFGIQLRAHRWRPPSSPAAVFCTLLAVYASVVTFGFPVLERVRPTPAVGRWISSHLPPSEPIGMFHVGEWNASLRYYSGRQVVPLDDAAALRTFLQRSSTATVVMRRRDYRAFQATGERLRVLFGQDAVVGMKGKGLRQQVWGRLLVVTRDDTPSAELAAR